MSFFLYSNDALHFFFFTSSSLAFVLFLFVLSSAHLHNSPLHGRLLNVPLYGSVARGDEKV